MNRTSCFGGESNKMSTQVEMRPQSGRQRRSLLPGPKGNTVPVKTQVRCSNLPSPTSPSSGFKHLLIGQEVSTSDGKVGILRFKGKTHFTQGFLCGIELYDAVGKNDGSVDGIYYFECLNPHGLFVPAYKVFPSGPPNPSNLPMSDKPPADSKVSKKLQRATVTSKKLPRPKTLPFSEGVIQKDKKLKLKKSSSNDSQSSRASNTAKSKEKSSLPSSKHANRKISPLNTSVTCPGWLSEDASKSTNSQYRKKDLNGTFTIPGEGETNLQSNLGTGRKELNKTKNGYQQESSGTGKVRVRLGSVPSYQDLTDMGDSDEEMGTPTRPDIVEDCQSRVNRTYDMDDDGDDLGVPPLSPVTFKVGSQESLEAWEDNAISCGKSNSSLAWDFDIPVASTPVEYHVRGDKNLNKAQQSEEDEDFISTDDEIEYNEFLAIPSYLDKPTGRYKFDLLTPEELEEALNQSNLLPDELRHTDDDDEEQLPNPTLSNIRNTPIWEPITPVEEEFLPFAAGTNLDPAPLAFWSMDENLPKLEQRPPNKEGHTEMDFISTASVTLESAPGKDCVKDTVTGSDINSDVIGIDKEPPPCDLLEGIGSETILVKNDVIDGVVKSPSDPSPVMVELLLTNSNPEYSDSSSCSNKTVKENISGLEKLADNVTDDLKIALKESEIVKEIQSQTFEKECGESEVLDLKTKVLIKPKTDTKAAKKPAAKKLTTKDRGVKCEVSKSYKPPIPPKLSVIPRRKTLEPGKIGPKLTEAKSKINTGRKSLPSNVTLFSKEKAKAKESTSNNVKDLKQTRRSVSLQPRTGRDLVSRQSSSSAASDVSKGTDSKPSSRPSSVKSDASSDDITRKPVSSQKNTTNSSEQAPSRRTGPCVPGNKKPPTSSVDSTKPNKRILPKAVDPKQTRLRKTRLPSGASTPPDVVHASIPDVHTNGEIKRLENLCNNQSKQLDAACNQIRVNAKAFETMAVLVQYLTEKCDALEVPSLKNKLSSLEEQVKETSSHVAGLEEVVSRHEKELGENKMYHRQNSGPPTTEELQGDSSSVMEKVSLLKQTVTVEGTKHSVGSDGLLNHSRGEPEGQQQIQQHNSHRIGEVDINVGEVSESLGADYMEGTEDLQVH